MTCTLPTAPAPVPSPCIGVCRINAATGWCEGCWRSLDEIGAWRALDEQARLALWQAIASRSGGQRQLPAAPAAPARPARQDTP